MDNSNCSLKLEIIAHPLGSSSNGYACRYTGGHCIPCKECERRRADPAVRLWQELENNRNEIPVLGVS